MKALVVTFWLLGVMTCFSWNVPQQVEDTPEVAAAKAAHFAAVAKANQQAKKKEKSVPTSDWDQKSHNNEVHKPSWNEEEEQNIYADDGNDGSWEDDELWKNYDDGSWNDKSEPDGETEVKPESEWNNPNNQKWTGPVALPPGYDESGAPLPVEDTAEVKEAKAKHLLLHARAARLETAPTPKKYVTPKKSAKKYVPSNQKMPPRRTVPLRPAPVFEVDEVVDTPEVAAAKIAHFAAHAKRRAAY